MSLLATIPLLLATCTTKNAPPTKNTSSPGPEVPAGTNASADRVVASETEPEPGTQGTKCDPRSPESKCKEGLECRFGGKSFTQCLRTQDKPFNFEACKGPRIDDFPERKVDCKSFVVNNTTEPGVHNCPLPEKNGDQVCTQAILGRFLQTGPYLNCPEYYTVLNRTDWTQDINDDFVYCAATGQLNATCEPDILLVSGQLYIQDIYTHNYPITSLELCQLHKMGCEFTDWGFDQGTTVRCPKRE